MTDVYCWGGYAKTSPELFAFIENFEEQYTVPLEPIYTGKMMFGLFDLIKTIIFQRIHAFWQFIPVVYKPILEINLTHKSPAFRRPYPLPV